MRVEPPVTSDARQREAAVHLGCYGGSGWADLVRVGCKSAGLGLPGKDSVSPRGNQVNEASATEN